MLCDKCGQKEATVHLCEIRRGIPSEFHICESCAEMFLPQERADIADLLEQLPPLTGPRDAIYLERGSEPESEELWMTGVGQHILLWEEGSGELRRVDPETGRSFDPVWSSDSRHLAHLLMDQGRYAIRVVTAAGEHVRVFYDVTPGERPQWTPDGRKLCFSWGQGEVSTPVLADVESGEVTRLHDRAGVQEFSPVLSPDGKRIAMLSTVQENPSEGRLVLVEVESRQRQVLVEAGDELIGTVSWSPDGKYLAIPVLRTPLSEMPDFEALETLGAQDLKVLEVARRQVVFEIAGVLGCAWRADANELVIAVEMEHRIDLLRTGGPNWPKAVTVAQDVVLPRTEVAVSGALWSSRGGQVAAVVGSSGNSRLVVGSREIAVENPRLAAWRPGTDDVTVLTESTGQEHGHEVLCIRPTERDKSEKLAFIPVQEYYDVVGLTWAADGKRFALEAHSAERSE